MPSPLVAICRPAALRTATDLSRNPLLSLAKLIGHFIGWKKKSNADCWLCLLMFESKYIRNCNYPMWLSIFRLILQTSKIYKRDYKNNVWKAIYIMLKIINPPINKYHRKIILRCSVKCIDPPVGYLNCW